MFDQLRIADFLQHPIDLQSFCDYYEKKVDNHLLGFKFLTGANLTRKAQDLVSSREAAGYLSELVVHMVSYWFEQVKGAPEKLLEKKLHEDLCVAAQKLWVTSLGFQLE